MPEPAFPAVVAAPGVIRQVLSERPELMLVSFRFERGAEGLSHSHPHVQASYVHEGRFLFTVDGETMEIGPGDSLVVPANAVHGCRCLEAGVLIDSFAPRRDDFL